MNILFIHQNFPGQFKSLVPALLDKGHDISVLTTSNLTNYSIKNMKNKSNVKHNSLKMLL